VQHAALTRRLQGHFNYFGVSGNARSLRRLLYAAKRSWFKWLQRRSQRRHLTWEQFGAMYARYPLPPPRITVRIWAT
jgi:RNA-directed DNA polymerase